MGVCMSHNPVLVQDTKSIPLRAAGASAKSLKDKKQSKRAFIEHSNVIEITNYDPGPTSPLKQLKFGPTQPRVSPKRLQLSPSKNSFRHTQTFGKSVEDPITTYRTDYQRYYQRDTCDYNDS